MSMVIMTLPSPFFVSVFSLMIIIIINIIMIKLSSLSL